MISQNLKDFIKRDFTYIMITLFALLACLYTIYTIGDYQQSCNEYWQEQYEDCLCSPQPFTQPYKILGVIINGTQNNNTNT